MTKVSGWNVYTKEELKNIENTKMVITEMIQNNQHELISWKKESGMHQLLECQNNALYNALTALSQFSEHEI